MAPRRHGIGPDARSDGESGVRIDPSSRRDDADGPILCRFRWAAMGTPASLSLLAVVLQHCFVATPGMRALSGPSWGHWVFRQSLDRSHGAGGSADGAGGESVPVLPCAAVVVAVGAVDCASV